MNLIKSKRAVLLILLISILAILGFKNAEAALGNRYLIRPNIDEGEIVTISQNITEEEAKEITIKLFKKYFNEKIDTENLFETTRLLKVGDQYNFLGKDHWLVSWSTFDYSKVGNMPDLTDDETKQFNKEQYYATSFDALLDAKTGEIIDIGKIDGERYGQLTIEELKERESDIEVARDIALDYIKKNKLIDNTEDLEFLGETRIIPESCHISFKYNEDKAITIIVEILSQKVSGFYYKDGEKAKDAIKYYETYKIDGGIG